MLTQSIFWFQSQPVARLLAGVLFWGLLAWMFFRASQGTGRVLFAMLATALCLLFAFSPALQLLASIPVLLLVGLVAWRLERRRQTYRPAVATVEGGGIKRGLTAPEAAVLLELPVSTVLIALLVSLLKAGLAEPGSGEALTLQVTPGYDPLGGLDLRRSAQLPGAVLHGYEGPFLAQLGAGAGRPLAEVPLAVPLKLLVRWVADRVGGHNLSETQEYYRLLVLRARRDAEAAPGGVDLEKVIDHQLAWLLLDSEARGRFRGDWGHYRPPWARRGPGTETGSFNAWLDLTQAAITVAMNATPLRARTADGRTISLKSLDLITAEVVEAVTQSG